MKRYGNAQQRAHKYSCSTSKSNQEPGHNLALNHACIHNLKDGEGITPEKLTSGGWPGQLCYPGTANQVVVVTKSRAQILGKTPLCAWDLQLGKHETSLLFALYGRKTEKKGLFLGISHLSQLLAWGLIAGSGPDCPMSLCSAVKIYSIHACMHACTYTHTHTNVRPKVIKMGVSAVWVHRPSLSPRLRPAIELGR